MSADWSRTDGRNAGAVTVAEFREIGEVVKTANYGVKRHGSRARMLGSIADIGLDVPGDSPLRDAFRARWHLPRY